MRIINGIAYADENAREMKIEGVRPLDGHKLWLRFSNGEAGTFDFAPLLGQPAFTPLADFEVFREVGLEHGVPVWQGGDIDISPQYLYDHAARFE